MSLRLRCTPFLFDGGVEVLMRNADELILLPSRRGSVGIFIGIVESGPDAEFAFFYVERKLLPVRRKSP